MSAFGATTAPPLPVVAPAGVVRRLMSGPRFDWIFLFASTWLLGGVYLDGWAHVHGKVDQSFFTPWHAVLYSGFAAVAGVLTFHVVTRYRPGHPWCAAIAPGYELSLLGAVIFLAAGLGDLTWHLLFGIEVDLEQLLSPTHLLLALGTILIVSGPLRATWRRASRDERRASPALAAARAAFAAGAADVPLRGRRFWQSWLARLPMVLSLALTWSLLSFMSQFVHPAVDTWAARLPAGRVALHGEIYTMRPDGAGQTRLALDPRADLTDPAWSPDGRQIAFTRYTSQSGRDDPSARDLTSDVYVMNADGSGLRRLTDDPARDALPTWSPDGRRLAYASFRGGHWHIYLMEADGSNPARVTDGPSNDLPTSWSSDGRRLALHSDSTGTWQVYTLDLDTGSQTRLTNGPAENWGAAWSPDGRRLALTSARDGNLEIYTMNADGSAPTRLTAHSMASWFPVWSPDGSRLAFVSDRDGNNEVYVMNADGSGQTDLSRNSALEDGQGHLSWSADGATILYTAHGHVAAGATPAFRQPLGIAAILLQSGLLVGLLLLALQHGPLPFGGFTLVFGLNAALMSAIGDQTRLIPAALVAGLVADVLAQQLRPAPSRPAALRLFAFAVPCVFYALYFLTLHLTGGVGWSLPLWSGTIVLAGATGLLLSCLVPPPPPTLAAPLPILPAAQPTARAGQNALGSGASSRA